MHVDFKFKPGDLVTDCNDAGLFIGIVDRLSINAAGHKLVYVVHARLTFDDNPGALSCVYNPTRIPIQTAEGNAWHPEDDLAPVSPAAPEPHFDLKAHDTLAAETVRFWVHLAEESGHVPAEKIAGAIAIADAMDAWPHHRLPD